LDDALGFAERALALDPSFARCHALIATIHNQRNANSFSTDPAADAAAAERAAQRAIALDSNDATIVMTYGLVLMFSFSRRVDALALLDRAIDLDPNLAGAWTARGICKGNQGRIDEAIQDFEHALRLNPRDPRRFMTQHGLAFAHFMAGRYDEAVSLATAVLQVQPRRGVTLRVAIAAHALAGRTDEARKVLAAHMKIEPETRISTLRETYLRRLRPEVFEILVDGLRKAGFPE
jgi:tetratricopeptide (TPR) repeat protein